MPHHLSLGLWDSFRDPQPRSGVGARGPSENLSSPVRSEYRLEIGTVIATATNAMAMPIIVASRRPNASLGNDELAPLKSTIATVTPHANCQ